MITRPVFLALAALLTGLLLAFSSHLMAASQTDTVSGRLSLVWGDHAPGTKPSQDSPLRVTLTTDSGDQIHLEPRSAVRAADGLFALNGQQVAVVLATNTGNTATGLLTSSAIVPLAATPQSGTRPNDAIIGSQPWASILCKFADNSAEPEPLAYFTGMYANQPGLLDHYWREVSYGKANVAGSHAYGWFTLPHPRDYYFDSNGSADLNALFDDCTGVADASVDFSLFVGINQMFNGELDGFAWGGSWYASLDGRSGFWRVTWNPPWAFHNLAPLAHEMGHGFGLPHANNSDMDNDPYDNPWDVMSDAWDNATYSSDYGYRPKHISIWSRDYLGWVDSAERLVLDHAGAWTSIPLDFAEMADINGVREIRINPPDAPTNRYYTVEARMKSGLYEGALAATTVIVHQVDTTRYEPAWSVDKDIPPADVSNNRGSQFLVGDDYLLEPGIRIRIVAATASGFLVDVYIQDSIFANGFEAP